MASINNGPFYVILGGDHPGILNERPTGMAMGAFAPLLPIVVTCASHDHAVAVNSLNRAFARSSSRDAHTLAYSVQESALDIPNHKTQCPIYAIRTTIDSKETGVWIGFGWYTIEKNIRQPLTVEKFTGKCVNAKEAIIYMLHKPNFYFPLRVEGQPIPPPRERLPREEPGAAVPPMCPSGAASPAQSRTIFTPAAAQIRSPARSRARASCASTSSDDSFASAEEDGLHDALASLAISNAGDAVCERADALAIQVLARIITPPPSMVPASENIFRFPISFGAQADKFLMMRGVNERELWLLLQARVHAANIDQFVHHLTLLLGQKFNGTDGHYLWANIQFPCL